MPRRNLPPPRNLDPGDADGRDNPPPSATVPPSVPLLIGLIRLVRDCCQKHEREICGKLSLTSSQLSCLLAVQERAEFSVNRAAESMGLSPSRASRVIDSLVRQGLLNRREAESDRRAQLLALTVAGRAKWREARSLMVECEQKVLAKLTDQSSLELEETLRKLVNAW